MYFFAKRFHEDACDGIISFYDVVHDDVIGGKFFTEQNIDIT